MSQTSSSAVLDARQNPRASRGRGAIVLVLIVSLLGSAGARYWADEKRSAAMPARGEIGGGTSLSNMNSFALGLLLGGLRGPLVMILWSESESQKSDKNLEGIDTKIEWIRLLQPEFDTVHIFQIWNKAYNISAQMASLANKYSVILGALDYAQRVDRQKPEDINILSAIGQQIYFEKFGNSTEKTYYRRHVRKETQWHVSSRKLREQDPGWRATELDPMLDEHGYLLPDLLKPVTPRPANLPADAEFNDGSQLQYLAGYQPFLDGLSPFALAYNYDKRAEVLQSVYQQHHAQLSELVIDSRPALALKNWLEEEWEQGRVRELQAFGLESPDQRLDVEPMTADFTLDHPVQDRAAANLALLAYDRGAKLLPAVLAEYVRHLTNNPTNEANYRSHMVQLQAEAAMCAADRDYLKAQLAASGDRAALLPSARKNYIQAIYYNELMTLKYFFDPGFLTEFLPSGFARLKTSDHKGLEDLTTQQMDSLYAAAMAGQEKKLNSHSEDQKEYQIYIDRARTRLKHLP